MQQPGVFNSSESPKIKRLRLRLASFVDHEQIAAVQSANGLSTKSREEWIHLWQCNPAYRELRNWPIGWVLEDPDGRVVGCLENVPALYRFGGRTYVGAFGRGWAVEANYRAYSLLLIGSQLRQPNVDVLLTTTAGARTADLLTRGGWSRVPSGEWDKSAFWVTSYVHTVRKYLAAKAPPLVAAVSGPLLYLPLRLGDMMARLPHKFTTACSLQWCTGFDERFDRFWTELERNRPDLLLSIRDRQTLSWHFRYSLGQRRIWILTATQGGQVVAYAILEKKQAQALNLTRLLLVDFQAFSRDPQLASAMISAIFERCRHERIHVLENVGCWLEKRLPRVVQAPHRRSLGAWCCLYQTRNDQLTGALASGDSWCPTQYDADATL